METAVTELEKYLGVKKTEITLEDEWLRSNPAGTSEPLQTYLQDVKPPNIRTLPFISYTRISYQDKKAKPARPKQTSMTLLWTGYHDNFQAFRRDYDEKYKTQPYVHPVIQECWSRGALVSEADVEKAQARKAAYSTWLRNDILGGGGDESDFDAIMVYPVGDFAPLCSDVYRKDPRGQIPSYNWAEREDHQSSLSGVPSVVLSVGQIPQPSKVTGKSQQLPVAISLMSGAGTDTQLTALLVDLARKRHFEGKIKVGTHYF